MFFTADDCTAATAISQQWIYVDSMSMYAAYMRWQLLCVWSYGRHVIC